MQHTIYLFDGFQLDVTRRQLSTAGGIVKPLNSRAMDALLLLVASAGELVEKRRLMETVWPRAVVEENNLNQCILAIRRALGETAGTNRYVMTVPGRGYRFVSPVRCVARESDHEPPAYVPPVRALRVQQSPSTRMAVASAGMLIASLAVLLIAWQIGRQGSPDCRVPEDPATKAGFAGARDAASLAASSPPLHPNTPPRAYQ